VMVHDGGVLKRAGHPEAASDLTSLAGLKNVSLSTIMVGSNGEVLRLKELETYAKENEIPLITIAAIIRHRHQKESLIKKAAEAYLPTQHGSFKIVGFENAIS